MDPMNRKLFKSRDARNTLRNMGGITASSPELAQTVQQFQEGGRVIADFSDWQNMSRAERQAAGFPTSPIGGQMFFDRFGVGMGMNNPDQLFTSEGPAFVGEDTVMSQSVLPPEAPRAPVTRELTREGRKSTKQITVGNMPYLYDETTKEVFRVDGSAVTGSEQETVSRLIEETPEIQAQIDAPRLATEQSRVDDLEKAVRAVGSARTARDQETAAEELERAQRRLRELQESPAPLAPAQTTDDLPAIVNREEEVAAAEESDARRRKMDSDAAFTAAEDPADTDAPATDAPSVDPARVEALMPTPDDTADDIRSKYKDRLELFQEVLGEDEEGARNKSMDLAMIGLAIMSGQSPNALTNIAQGASAGLQAMSARDEASREQARKLRTSALESVLDEEAAATAAAADLAGRQYSRDTQLMLARLRNKGDRDSLYNDPFRTYAQAADAARARASDAALPPPDMLPGDTIESYAARAGERAVQEMSQSAARGFTSTDVDPGIKSRVDSLVEGGTDKAVIKDNLMQQFPGIDPSLYGL